ncbi:MAG: GTPase ObgE [Spirochaetaceae bacterium]|jgi:GTP-binding protein|nr:GTPase ObgE [Spirochaetaceae bacterium]
MPRGFVDETLLEVSSGTGGAGAVSFRREKYVPKGGPDGGDGGKGGDLVFVVKSNLKTLSHLSGNKRYKAKNGDPGRGRKCHGKDGEDLEITVPPGTIIRDGITQQVYKDFDQDLDGERWSFLRGGKGGLGNWHFRSARKQAPKYAQDGIPCQEASVLIELNVIADIGFVGFPSAGKSSLLRELTNANPKVAPYPFTTKIPNLGVLRISEKEVVLADIPGIIKGASHGIGLGFKFLKHISRTQALAFMLDLGEDNFLETYDQLLKELEIYEPSLLNKERLIIGTKKDLDEMGERGMIFEETFKSLPHIQVSIFTREGMEDLKTLFLSLAK